MAKPEMERGWNRSELIKIVGDACNTIAVMSICFAAFIMTLWLTVQLYYIDLTLVPVMAGIAFMCVISRATLLLQCNDCKLEDVFKPLDRNLVRSRYFLKSVGAVGSVIVLSLIYASLLSTTAYNETVHQACFGPDMNQSKEVVQACQEGQAVVQKSIYGTLVSLTIIMPVLFVYKIRSKISHFGRKKQLSEGLWLWRARVYLVWAVFTVAVFFTYYYNDGKIGILAAVMCVIVFYYTTKALCANNNGP